MQLRRCNARLSREGKVQSSEPGGLTTRSHLGALRDSGPHNLGEVLTRLSAELQAISAHSHSAGSVGSPVDLDDDASESRVLNGADAHPPPAMPDRSWHLGDKGVVRDMLKRVRGW